MKSLTPVGVARLIKRGLDAQYSDGIEQMAEFRTHMVLTATQERFSDMALSLARLVEAGEVDKAEDAEFLDAIATELDRLSDVKGLNNG